MSLTSRYDIKSLSADELTEVIEKALLEHFKSKGVKNIIFDCIVDELKYDVEDIRMDPNYVSLIETTHNTSVKLLIRETTNAES